jgi:hypothetical protein
MLVCAQNSLWTCAMSISGEHKTLLTPARSCRRTVWCIHGKGRNNVSNHSPREMCRPRPAETDHHRLMHTEHNKDKCAVLWYTQGYEMHNDRSDCYSNRNVTYGVQNRTNRCKLLIFLYHLKISPSKFWYSTVTQASHPSFYSLEC